MKKIAVFADVQNLYYTVRQVYGCHFDYSVLWAEVSRRGVIVEAYAYAIDRGDAKQQQFQQILRKLGITIDVLDAVERVDEIVLASGDGDFDLLLERVRSRGVEAIAYGAPGLTAQSLIRAASLYVPIEGDLLLRNH